jgi:hypothetical protein
MIKELTVKPESIKEVELNPDKAPEIYEGYLYRFTNLDDGCIYVGVHKGPVSDNYWHSSTDEEFKSICSNPNSNLKYEVLEYGDYDYMTVREHVILSSVDAKNNNKYYNKTNGSPKYKMINQEKIDNLVVRIEAGEFKVPNRPIEDIMDIEHLQVRHFELEPDHVRYIANSIDDFMGDIKYTDDIVLYEGRGTDGGEVLGDGNHTRAGINKSKHGKEAKVSVIPLSETEDMSNEDLISIGHLLNKGPRVKKIHFQPEDGVKYMVARADAGVPTSFPGHIDYLKELGLNGQQIRRVRDKADNIIAENEMAKGHKTWIRYSSKEIENTCSQYRDKDTIVVGFSSTMFAYPMLLDALTLEDNKDKKNLVMVVHHKNKVAERNWNTRIAPKAYINLEYILGPRNIQFSFAVQPTQRINKLSEFTK